MWHNLVILHQSFHIPIVLKMSESVSDCNSDQDISIMAEKPNLVCNIKGCKKNAQGFVFKNISTFKAHFLRIHNMNHPDVCDKHDTEKNTSKRLSSISPTSPISPTSSPVHSISNTSKCEDDDFPDLPDGLVGHGVLEGLDTCHVTDTGVLDDLFSSDSDDGELPVSIDALFSESVNVPRVSGERKAGKTVNNKNVLNNNVLKRMSYSRRSVLLRKRINYFLCG